MNATILHGSGATRVTDAERFYHPRPDFPEEAAEP
jgi:hypothetical protein